MAAEISLEIGRPFFQHTRGEPEPLQMPDTPDGAVVLVGRAAVHDVIVVDELDVTLDKTRLKNTMRTLYNEAQDLEL